MGDIRESLDKSEKLLCKALEEINDRGALNANDLQLMGQVMDAVKDIYSVKEKMGGGSYERSYMDDGYSRGRRRDSMGRYMDDGYSRYNDGGYNRGYSAEYGTYRADSYGHSDEEEKEYLRWKMQNAKSEQEREKIRRKLEQM